jgi:hypothetical protein
MVDDNSLPALVENLEELLSKKDNVYRGTLKVFLVHAENLASHDSDKSADPKVIFKAPGGKEVVSKTVNNSLNPVWKTIYDVPLSMAKDVKY